MNKLKLDITTHISVLKIKLSYFVVPSWPHDHPKTVQLFSWRLFNIHHNYRGATERNRCSKTSQLSHSFTRIQVGYINRLQMICFSPFRLLIEFFFLLLTKNNFICYAIRCTFWMSDTPSVSPSFLPLNYGFSVASFFFRVRVKLAQKLAEGIRCLQNYLQNQLPYYMKFWQHVTF